MDFTRLKKQDFVLTFLIFVLSLIGTSIIFSVTYNTIDNSLLIKQLILLTLGFCLYFVVMITDINWFKITSIQILMYIFIISSLLYVNLFGSSIAGTNRWIDFGLFSFQPSEYSKILVLLFISLVFSNEFVSIRDKLKKERRAIEGNLMNFSFRDKVIRFLSDKDTKGTFLSLIYVAPIAFLTFIQPSLGNTLIIMLLTGLAIFFSISKQKIILKSFIIFSTIFLALKELVIFDNSSNLFLINNGTNKIIQIIVLILLSIGLARLFKIKIINLSLIFLTVIIAIFGFVFSWNNIFTDYQKTRIITFISGPESDPLGSGFQIIQSKIAIGSGQLLGRGYLQGTQSNLHILTQSHTDFAFASMSEQFGFIGSILVLLIFLALILRITHISKTVKSSFGRNFCLGTASLLLIHVFINIGMNIGRLPVTGIPLPLVSYGGSSVFMTLIILGLVQSIYVSRRPVDMADSLMITSLRSKKR